MRSIIVFVLLSVAKYSSAQELFTYTEPASNMPVKSFAIRANNYLQRSTTAGDYSYSFAPEIMFGISKELMVHGEAFFGNQMNDFRLDGASFYAKYRFYTKDEVHEHFRMAVTAKTAIANMPVIQPAIDLAGKNSGAELGFVATQLLNRTAYSGGVSFVNAFDNTGSNKFPVNGISRNAINYTLSFGHLILPKEYKDYNQPNLNVMLELLGQTNTGNGTSFLDLAPSLQVILKSKIRLDAGYRVPLVHSLQRIQDRGFLLRIEYNFFNAFR